MAGTSEFLYFAKDPSADVESQTAYESLASTTVGFATGTALTTQLNKVWRQGSAGSAILGRFIADALGIAVLDDGNLDTLLANFELAVQTFIGRRRLTANADFYVATTGNDSNPGTQLLPWRTLQHAWDYPSQNLDPGQFKIKVHVGAGTFANFQAFGNPIAPILFEGDTTTPSNVVISATNATAVWAQAGGQVELNGFRFVASGTGDNQGFGILAGPQATVVVGTNVEFGSCAVACMRVVGGGFLATDQISRSAIRLLGTSGSWCQSDENSSMNVSGATVTLTGSPHFTHFMQSVFLSSILRANMTFVGAAGAGDQYLITENSIIRTNGDTANWPTGLSAGAPPSSGGQLT